MYFYHGVGGSDDDDESAEVEALEKSVNGATEVETADKPVDIVRFNFKELMPKERVIRMNEGKASLKPFFIVHPIEGKTLFVLFFLFNRPKPLSFFIRPFQ